MRATVLPCAITTVTASLVGCAYHPSSFHSFQHDFPGQRVSVDCVDLAIDRRPDLSGGSAVIGYTFGNRCDHPATIDLSRVGIVGRTVDGRDVDLSPFDPGHELRPLQIDGRSVGEEAIAYPSGGHLAEVCIDAASIAHTVPAKWVCFATSSLPGGGYVATKEAP